MKWIKTTEQWPPFETIVLVTADWFCPDEKYSWARLVESTTGDAPTWHVYRNGLVEMPIEMPIWKINDWKGGEKVKMAEQKNDNESTVEIKNGWLLISQKYSDGKIEKFSVQISNICNIFDGWGDHFNSLGGRGTFILSCNDTNGSKGLFIQKPYEEILRLLTIETERRLP